MVPSLSGSSVMRERTLVVPDRLGNRRLDSFENMLLNPAAALIFIVPGNHETLRVAGRARIVLDRAIQERHAVNGKPRVLALVLDVEQAFMHRLLRNLALSSPHQYCRTIDRSMRRLRAKPLACPRAASLR